MHASGMNAVDLLGITRETHSNKAETVKKIVIAPDVPYDLMRRRITTIAPAIRVTCPSNRPVVTSGTE